jgi:uncharacterized protein YndB with AHSA1/START domain
MTTDGAGPRSRPVGALRRSADGRGTVRVQDHYRTGVEDLWAAVTEPQRLARWIADVDGELRLGGRFTARFTSGWSGPGRVDVCEPPRRLLVTMSPGQPDETVIEARLTPTGDRTHLVVEERGLPLDDLPFHGAGWQVHLEDLAAHLLGEAASDWRSRWTELTPGYRALDVGTA